MYKNKRQKADKKNNVRISSVIFRILGSLLLLLLAIVFFALIRGRLIDVRTYSVSSSASGKVKIVGLTDLHGNMLGKKQGRLVSKIRNQNPDLIVYVGDMVERERAEESIKPLVVLTEQLSKVAPVYYVDGNHEQDVLKSDSEVYEKLNKALADAGATHLDNEMVQLSIGGDKTVVNLCGISTHYWWGEEELELTEKLRNRDGIKVLICHYPESVIWYEAFAKGELDLAICGHTHGGLIQVPFKGGMYAPEWGLWPLYDLGEYPIYTDTTWKRYGGEEGSAYLGTMIISGGLSGEHGVPRVNNPMEISVVNLGR